MFTERITEMNDVIQVGIKAHIQGHDCTLIVHCTQ